MEFNKNSIKGKWREIKGDVQKSWGKLTDDELEKTKGDLNAINGLIQQKYGKSDDNFSDKLSSIFNRYDAKKDEAMTKMKKNLKNMKNSTNEYVENSRQYVQENPAKSIAIAAVVGALSGSIFTMFFHRRHS